MQRDALVNTVSHIVDLLVRGEYARLAEESAGGITAEMMQQAIAERPARLAFPSGGMAPLIRCAIPISQPGPARYGIDVDLWTEEEGRSDLTLLLQVTDVPGPLLAFTVEDIHVL